MDVEVNVESPSGRTRIILLIALAAAVLVVYAPTFGAGSPPSGVSTHTLRDLERYHPGLFERAWAAAAATRWDRWCSPRPTMPPSPST